MTVRNLTGKNVVVLSDDAQLVTYPAEALVLDVALENHRSRATDEGVELAVRGYGPIVGAVPKPVPNVLLIVSRNVWSALPGRADMVTVDESDPDRNDDGSIRAYRRLLLHR